MRVSAERLLKLRFPTCEAFTRYDLIALCAIGSIVATISVSALTTSRHQSTRIACMNNLREVGHAFRLWASGHDDRIPAVVPMQEGGLVGHPLSPNPWVQFAWISNELRTAKVLACPADENRVRANDFSDVFGGFTHGQFQNRALSYFMAHPSADMPQAILSGDRNFLSDRVSACPNFVSAQVAPRNGMGWTNSIHENSGNLLLNDGHVEQLSNAQLRESERRYQPVDDNTIYHFIAPR